MLVAGNSQPPSEFQKPFERCTVKIATNIVETTSIGPIGPAKPTTMKRPPKNSLSPASVANNSPGRNPSDSKNPHKNPQPKLTTNASLPAAGRKQRDLAAGAYLGLRLRGRLRHGTAQRE